MKKQRLAIIIVVVAALTICTVTFALLNNSQSDVPTEIQPEPEETEPLNYTYSVVNTYWHDSNAFTQGLVFEDGNLYEGTGRYGSSTIREVQLETGNVTKISYLSDIYFGEGITVFEDKIIQLTWKNNVGFVYNKTTFEFIQSFSYQTDGWGLTHNGSHLIMSDGSATLYFLDPQTFQTVGQIEVADDEPVTKLNELEYINGHIYANVWMDDKIAIINPETGVVEGWIDLTGINEEDKTSTDAVLNGIAYDKNSDRLFVTGKLWSKLFEIRLVLVD